VGSSSYEVLAIGSWRARYRVPNADLGALGAAFSPDGRFLAVVIEGHTIELLDAASGRVLADLEAPGQWFTSCPDFSPTGNYLAAIVTDRHVLVWDLSRLRSELANLNLNWDAPVAKTE
jgi:WD40 repeat protein